MIDRQMRKPELHVELQPLKIEELGMRRVQRGEGEGEGD